MNEKIIITGTKLNIKKIVITITVILALVIVGTYFYFVIDQFAKRPLIRFNLRFILRHFSVAAKSFVNNDLHISLLTPVLVLIVLDWMVYFWAHVPHIVVTNKRIYGSTTLGERLDMPIDSITSVSKRVNAVTITTASRVVRFDMIANYEEVHRAISELLIKRQSVQVAAPVIVKQEVQHNDIDDLRKYKKLLDDGIITQEDFDAKKKQLLGL